MAFQVDIIPATGTDYFTTNIEDGIALADAALRAELRGRATRRRGRGSRPGAGSWREALGIDAPPRRPAALEPPGLPAAVPAPAGPGDDAGGLTAATSDPDFGSGRVLGLSSGLEQVGRHEPGEVALPGRERAIDVDPDQGALVHRDRRPGSD